ncbi:ubiquitin-conjugating enzyme E2 D2B-like isoform X2 [Haliotis rubra]|uniref:ubiquitin-conjugating enzyme E2 D2B-like isoform X2 n=1 Tax=Haliotis rubra TaxID=36100 RepID=UPI001EE620F3|nr:ubiquitin-conjugating enzyme E2 D2B-like isoform X2 [Haliotis rubra]
MALRRIYKEWQNFVEDPIKGISYGPPLDHWNHWDAIIEGPAGTPYEGGSFMLDVVIPVEYPFAPPKVQFKTRVYHPNISRKGVFKLDVLRDQWSSPITVAKVLLYVRCLLVDDINPDDPLEPDIARLYKTDRAKYEQTVREWTKKYAM